MSDLAADPGEDLDDGTRATTPDGDNLLLDFARTEAAAYGSLVAANGGVLLEEPGWSLADLAIGSPFGNVALIRRPIPAREEAAVVERFRGFFAERDGGPYLVFSPWPTGDWSVHGLDPVGHPPVMFRPPAADGAERPEVTIRLVSDEAVLADFERTMIEAYPLSELLPWAPGTYLAPGLLETPWRLFVGDVDGQPVATAAAYLGPEVTAVELVSTRPEARGGASVRR